jgi:hypothetical protein
MQHAASRRVRVDLAVDEQAEPCLGRSSCNRHERLLDCPAALAIWIALAGLSLSSAHWPAALRLLAPLYHKLPDQRMQRHLDQRKGGLACCPVSVGRSYRSTMDYRRAWQWPSCLRYHGHDLLTGEFLGEPEAIQMVAEQAVLARSTGVYYTDPPESIRIGPEGVERALVLTASHDVTLSGSGGWSWSGHRTVGKRGSDGLPDSRPDGTCRRLSPSRERGSLRIGEGELCNRVSNAT